MSCQSTLVCDKEPRLVTSRLRVSASPFHVQTHFSEFSKSRGASPEREESSKYRLESMDLQL